MDFQKFKFTDVRQKAINKGLLFSKWISFHDNTEFKARAALFHLEQLINVYEKYIEENPLPDVQTVFNYYHPLKEIIFFEFHSVVMNLIGVFDSLLQEINCAYKLGLKQLQTKGDKHVTFLNVNNSLKQLYPNCILITELEKLEQKSSNEHYWFNFLRQMRNIALHSDIYTNSEENKDINTIIREIKKINERAKTEKIEEAEIFKLINKRDIVITVGNRNYFMLRLIIKLKEHMLEYVKNIHNIMIEDITNGIIKT